MLHDNTVLQTSPLRRDTVQGIFITVLYFKRSIRFQDTCVKHRISRPITRALSIQKGSEIVKNEHARYTLERFPTDNERVICTKKGIGKYGIMY